MEKASKELVTKQRICPKIYILRGVVFSYYELANLKKDKENAI